MSTYNNNAETSPVWSTIMMNDVPKLQQYPSYHAYKYFTSLNSRYTFM